MRTPISHYCQKCLAANPLGQDFCARCGTRLMLVVEPSAARFEIADQVISTDEHLLERISIVENRITRLTERLERSLDLLLRQAQNSYFDRSLIKTLIGILTDDGLVETSRLEQLWNDRCQTDAAEQQELTRRNEVRTQILAAPPVADSQVFVNLVGEAFVALEDHQTEVGIDKLQRAAMMTESNSALNLFIGEYFFRSGKPGLAMSYFAKVHQAAPDDVRVALLLGLTCADAGDSEKAKKLLANVIERGGSCFAGHYGLGWLHMLENKSRKALTHFKRALEVCPSPEAHFALASLYYELERHELATRHLKKAIELDGAYKEAYSLLALVYQRMGLTDQAEDAIRQADSTSPSRNKVKARSSTPTKTQALKKGLMTGGNKRLATALKEDALRAFPRAEAISR